MHCRHFSLLAFAFLSLAATSPEPARPQPCRCQTAPLMLDCNQNGVEDSIDIATGASSDLDLNGVPDECDEQARNGPTRSDD